MIYFLIATFTNENARLETYPRLEPQVSLFFSFSFFFFLFSLTSNTNIDSVHRNGLVTERNGSNDASSIIWAVSKLFFFSFRVLLILTKIFSPLNGRSSLGKATTTENGPE
jgi:hypothetical protein